MDDNQKPIVKAWNEAKTKLDELKKEEMRLRKEAMSAVFGDTRNFGTNRDEIGNGYFLTLTVPRKLDIVPEEFEKYKAQLESKGFIGSGCVIEMVPKVYLSRYEHMSDEDKSRFASVFKFGKGSESIKIERKVD